MAGNISFNEIILLLREVYEILHLSRANYNLHEVSFQRLSKVREVIKNLHLKVELMALRAFKKLLKKSVEQRSVCYQIFFSR